jgi:hypothetical protein
MYVKDMYVYGSCVSVWQQCVYMGRYMYIGELYVSGSYVLQYLA